jgi:hypothetical protein
MITFKQFIDEDGAAAGVGGGSAPANVAGGIAGTGGQAGEPGVSKKRKSSILTVLPLTRKNNGKIFK